MAIAPVQQRSLDAFSDERFSQVINRLTRMISGGTDCILFGTGSFPLTQTDYKTIQVGPGICLKDDVMIHIYETFDIDFTDELFYFDSESGMDTDGDYYIVCSYDYQRSLPGPNCYYRIIKHVDLSFIPYPERFLFVGRVEVDYNAGESRYEIVDVHYNDIPREIYRVDAKIFTHAIVDGGEI